MPDMDLIGPPLEGHGRSRSLEPVGERHALIVKDLRSTDMNQCGWQTGAVMKCGGETSVVERKLASNPIRKLGDALGGKVVRIGVTDMTRKRAGQVDPRTQQNKGIRHGGVGVRKGLCRRNGQSSTCRITSERHGPRGVKAAPGGPDGERILKRCGRRVFWRQAVIDREDFEPRHMGELREETPVGLRGPEGVGTAVKPEQGAAGLAFGCDRLAWDARNAHLCDGHRKPKATECSSPVQFLAAAGSGMTQRGGESRTNVGDHGRGSDGP